MRNVFLIVMFAGFILAGCKSHSKKLIIYTNTDGVIDEAAKTITQKTTEGHVDKSITYPGGDKLTLTVKLLSGEKNIDVQEDGYYIVNIKAKDTIIGGYQKFSPPEEANKLITQAQLAKNIDSLKQMVANTNISAANKTFFIPPYTADKFTDNEEAFVVGPYHRMTSIEKVGDKDPEVYRFYTINEVREIITQLEKLTDKSSTDSTSK